MGQPIQVEVTQIDDVLLFDTDRSITGQDGVVYASRDEALDSDRFPAQLAARIFSADSGVNHVFVASNQVVVRRTGGWDQSQTDAAAAVVADFFLYYPDAANA
jgi:hypothetical protein